MIPSSTCRSTTTVKTTWIRSPRRVMLLCLSSHRRWVLEEPVEVAGEVALEAAVCFAAGFAFLQSPFHVGDCRGVCASPGDQDEVQRSVESAVTAAVEPVADRFA